ncbi:Glycine oxidase [uncultured Pleomorphomonas sp.]|nr:FAD-dependent oxidoreductase [Pleomorphomonas carboxyditropha]SCM72522.1 Glycine oxidase [uncultured Pleomorphomonas sp.]
MSEIASGKREMVDVAIVGAGPMGLVTALMCARAGLKVAIYERQGDFSASPAWNGTGVLAPDCEADVADATIVDLGRRSLDLWPTLIPGFTLNGALVLGNRRQPTALDDYSSFVLNYEWADEERIAALEPSLAGIYNRGMYFPQAAHADPRVLFTGLKEVLEAAGIRIRFDWIGTIDGLQAERIVDTRGLGARDRFPELRAVTAEMAQVRSHKIELNRPIRLLHNRHALYVTPRGQGIYVIGATTVDDDRSGVSVRSAGELMTHAVSLLPAFADAEVVELRSGLMPVLMNGVPKVVVGDRIIAVNGLYRYGWMVAPAIAEDLLRVIYTQATKVIHASRPMRH